MFATSHQNATCSLVISSTYSPRLGVRSPSNLMKHECSYKYQYHEWTSSVQPAESVTHLHLRELVVIEHLKACSNTRGSVFEARRN